MSRQSARHITAAWLGGAPATDSTTDAYGYPLVYGRPSSVLPNVGSVFASRPTDENEQDYYSGLTDGTTTGAKLVIHLPGPDRETREGTKTKRIERRVLVQVLCHSTEPNVQDGQATFDNLLEELQTRIRIDPTFGTDSQSDPTKKIFQAGQTRYGLLLETAEPTMLPTSNILELYAQLAFDVTEFVIGY